MKHPDARIEALLSGLPATSKLPTIDLKTERIATFLAAIGNPQEKLPPVVHVAGTNGKGSLLAYLTAMLQAAGYKVHRYISPHLVRFNERILLADQEIDDAYLRELLGRITRYTDRYPLTFFEATTAMAFLAFSETPADIVLLETGLGGRLDATNLVTQPMLTAITPVSMDHMEYLGDTLAAIAGEKAGILKPRVQCVVGPQQSEALEVIERVANIVESRLQVAGRDWNVEAVEAGFVYRSLRQNTVYPLPALQGVHQLYNAGTAIACTESLKGFKLGEAHISQGLTSAQWPGRMQRLVSGSLAELLPQGSQLWLDGGHNAGAGVVIAQWEARQQKPVHLICGMLANKDVRGFLAPQAAHVKSLTAIPIDGEAAAMPPQQICNIGCELGIESDLKDNIKNAIQGIVNKNENNHLILICGSLYLAGNILWQNGKTE